MEAFAIEDLNFTYPTRSDKALSGISLDIHEGEMVVLCGASGCGKTTLLRQLKPALAPHGILSGVIRFKGTDLGELGLRESSAGIGFVMQSPENQVVTDKVWHELAFGLESLGEDSPTIRLRVAEIAAFFGIQSWFHKNVQELSGGQKQLLSLASIMAMQPSALLLDEPTSQLDPIAATEFLQTVAKINRDLGVTVILSEHRLEEAFALATRAVVMDQGKVILDGLPADVGTGLRALGSNMFRAMPAPMRIWVGVPNDLSCPLNVRDGRKWVDAMANGLGDGLGSGLGSGLGGGLGSGSGNGRRPERESGPANPSDSANPASPASPANPAAALPSHLHRKSSRALRAAEKLLRRKPLRADGLAGPVAVDLDELWFRYEKSLPDVVRGTSLKADAGQITAILGGNGSGKTTLLTLIAGLNKPYRGKVRLYGRPLERIPQGRMFRGLLGVLPQNPQTLFTAKTGREELADMLKGIDLSKEERQTRLQNIIGLCRLEGLLDAHPYDLSGGEQQRLALAMVLLLKPSILLLDEPTKGCDAGFKAVLAGILRKLADAGAAVMIVSHDIEFCAEHADKCALFFDGAVVTEGGPGDFFSGNSFYTSSANRMARHRFPGAITVSDVVAELGGQPEPYTTLLPDDWDDMAVYDIDRLDNGMAGDADTADSADAETDSADAETDSADSADSAGSADRKAGDADAADKQD